MPNRWRFLVGFFGLLLISKLMLEKSVILTFAELYFKPEKMLSSSVKRILAHSNIETFLSSFTALKTNKKSFEFTSLLNFSIESRNSWPNCKLILEHSTTEKPVRELFVVLIILHTWTWYTSIESNYPPKVQFAEQMDLESSAQNESIQMALNFCSTSVAVVI